MKVYVVCEYARDYDESFAVHWATVDFDKAVQELRRRVAADPSTVIWHGTSAYGIIEYDSDDRSIDEVAYSVNLADGSLMRDGAPLARPQADGATTPPDTE